MGLKTLQVYWKGWDRMPWHHKLYDSELEIWSHFAGFGPFQWSWYSK